MQYILCTFESGYAGNFYQEVSNGNVVRMTDMDGNTLDLPGPGENNFIPYCAFVIDPEPTPPAWAL